MTRACDKIEALEGKLARLRREALNAVGVLDHMCLFAGERHGNEMRSAAGFLRTAIEASRDQGED
jgi:hypothetical protein